VSEIKDKGSMDPLILLDEVDKLAHYKGDPAAALLELLDPEQNDHFIDQYLEVPLDLSKAMFICTANYENRIPEALLDRMEMIRFRAYDADERSVITRQFLLPKAQKLNNSTELPVTFNESALVEIIKIPQVRQIEKLLAKLVRRGVTQVHLHDAPEYVVTAEDVEKIKKNYKEPTKERMGF
jgi:ATP-dependent Lon protease